MSPVVLWAADSLCGNPEECSSLRRPSGLHPLRCELMNEAMASPRGRTERDTFGPIEVEASRYWGAQTERARRNFTIGWELQPVAIIHALGLIKRAAAEVNVALGR